MLNATKKPSYSLKQLNIVLKAALRFTNFNAPSLACETETKLSLGGVEDAMDAMQSLIYEIASLSLDSDFDTNSKAIKKHLKFNDQVLNDQDYCYLLKHVIQYADIIDIIDPSIDGIWRNFSEELKSLFTDFSKKNVANNKATEKKVSIEKNEISSKSDYESKMQMVNEVFTLLPTYFKKLIGQLLKEGHPLEAQVIHNSIHYAYLIAADTKNTVEPHQVANMFSPPMYHGLKLDYAGLTQFNDIPNCEKARNGYERRHYKVSHEYLMLGYALSVVYTDSFFQKVYSPKMYSHFKQEYSIKVKSEPTQFLGIIDLKIESEFNIWKQFTDEIRIEFDSKLSSDEMRFLTEFPQKIKKYIWLLYDIGYVEKANFIHTCISLCHKRQKRAEVANFIHEKEGKESEELIAFQKELTSSTATMLYQFLHLEKANLWKANDNSLMIDNRAKEREILNLWVNDLAQDPIFTEEFNPKKYRDFYLYISEEKVWSNDKKDKKNPPQIKISHANNRNLVMDIFNEKDASKESKKEVKKESSKESSKESNNEATIEHLTKKLHNLGMLGSSGEVFMEKPQNPTNINTNSNTQNSTRVSPRHHFTKSAIHSGGITLDVLNPNRLSPPRGSPRQANVTTSYTSTSTSSASQHTQNTKSHDDQDKSSEKRNKYNKFGSS